MAEANDSEVNEDEAPNYEDVTNIVVHYDEDFFLIEEHDTDYMCFMNLKGAIHTRLRLDCEVKLHVEGRLPGDRRMVIHDDECVLVWLKENEGDKWLHLYVEILKSPLQPVIEDPVVSDVHVSCYRARLSDTSDSDDESFYCSDTEECKVDSSDYENLENEPDEKGKDLLDEYDSDAFKLELNGSDSELETPYIDRAYQGHIYEPMPEGGIELKQGMIFPSVQVFKQTLKDYLIQEGFEIIRTRNERTRFTALCAGNGCEWYLHASTNADDISFEIKVYEDNHTCVKCSTNSEVNSTWIAHKMFPQFKADPNLSYEVIAEYLMSKYGVTVKKSQMYRAKKKAQEMVDGNHGQCYNKLRKYAVMVTESNPGSVAKLHVERVDISQNPLFKRFFLCLDALKKGFKKGCRPFIGMDGCHLKGPYGGVLLSAVSLDGNNGLFPVAFAVVEVENRDSWTWFLQLLENCIVDPTSNKPLVIMSDRQKGLVDAIADVLPYAQQRSCTRHLYNNFRAKFPGIMLRTLFWKAAKSYTDYEFDQAMAEIQKLSTDAHKWLMDRPKSRWSRSGFDANAKSDHITNNMSESFNNWVGQLRGKPVLTLLESLVCNLMGKLQTKYADGCRWESCLTPFAVKKLESLRSRTKKCSLVPAGQMEFLVTDDTTKFPIDLKTRSCPCNFWKQTGLPCSHALVCLTYLRADLGTYCDEHYKKDKYMLCYSEIIHPIPDLSMVNIPEEATDLVLPPVLKRLPGRPRKKKRLEESESKTTTAYKRSTTVKCCNCKQFGHNKRTCQRAPVAVKTKGKAKVNSSEIATVTESQASSSPTTKKTRLIKRKGGSRLNRNTIASSESAPVQAAASTPVQVTYFATIQDTSCVPKSVQVLDQNPSVNDSQTHQQ